MKRSERTELKKSLSPAAIWAVALGSIIGWGCFIQGANWTARAGGPLPLMIGFVVGGILMSIVGKSYSYMIAKFPVAGGEFAYAYQGYGRTASFICGWMLSLGYLSIVALNATALPVLAGYLFPGVFNQGFLYTIAGYDIYAGEVALSVFFIILFGALNYFGAKSVGNMQLTMVLIMCHFSGRCRWDRSFPCRKSAACLWGRQIFLGWIRIDSGIGAFLVCRLRLYSAGC